MCRVKPYYLYQCDLIAGSAHLRTSVRKGIQIMEKLRGHTTGYAVPNYVIDAPGGGGKRDAHSYEHYDRTTGISGFTSPNVHPGTLYFYFDPIDLLPAEGRARWSDPAEHPKMIAEAAAAARAHPY